MFTLDDGLIVSVYAREDMALDSGVELPHGPTSTIGHFVGSQSDADAFLDRARAAGATMLAAPYTRPWACTPASSRTRTATSGRSWRTRAAATRRMRRLPRSDGLAREARTGNAPPRPLPYGCVVDIGRAVVGASAVGAVVLAIGLGIVTAPGNTLSVTPGRGIACGSYPDGTTTAAAWFMVEFENPTGRSVHVADVGPVSVEGADVTPLRVVVHDDGTPAGLWVTDAP